MISRRKFFCGVTATLFLATAVPRRSRASSSLPQLGSPAAYSGAVNISVGSTSQGLVANNAVASSCTTTGVATQASGSGFIVGVFQQTNGTNYMPVTVTDSKSNTYTHISTQINNTASIALDRFYCEGGTGGSGHTVTAAITGSYAGTATGGTTTTLIDTSATWTVNQWAGYVGIDHNSLDQFVVTSNTANTLTFAAIGTAPANGDTFTIGVAGFNVFFCEAKNMMSTGALDKSATQVGFNGSPYGVGVTPTTGDLTNGELIVSFFANDYNGALSAPACAGGFTLQQSYAALGSFGYGVGSGMSTRVVTTAGTYTPSWTDGSASGAQNTANSTDSFVGS